MATPLKEPQGKILFKRTDIRTMKKDIKMLRELDAHKEQLKTLEPLTTGNQQAAEVQKQRVFALKSQMTQAGQLKSLDANKESLFTKEKNQLLARQNNQEAIVKNVIKKEVAVSGDRQREELEKRRWVAERSAAETKIRVDDLEAKNKELENQKAQLQQKITQTHDALRQASANVEKIKTRPIESTPATTSENEQRKKFMEDIEAWANLSKN